MTEMDEFSRFELGELRRQRIKLDEERQALTALMVAEIRKKHSRGYSDADIAKELGFQRKTVNSYRLYGQATPPKGGGPGAQPGGWAGEPIPGSTGAATP